jgi:GT2 family glycosyltransferase
LTVISILMLTHNRKGMVMRCLRSLGIEHPAVEWIILDNASTDGTAQFLLDTAREHGRMRVYLSGENKGVSGGRDWLLQQVNSDTLVFLDSDVVALEPHWLEKLVEPLESPATGLCGPGGNWVTPGWKWYEPVAPDYRGPVDTVSGYCQAFRAEVLEQGVRMDTAFGRYWHEDTDWCMQIRQLGLDIVCTGDIGLRHMYAGSGDDGTGVTKQRYLASKWRGKRLVRHERDAEGGRGEPEPLDQDHRR